VEAEARYTVVGIVVVALVSMAIWALVWLASRGQRSDVRKYTVYFKQHSLSGLQVDSYVTMRGIPVGSVKSLRILPTDIERVEVLVVVNALTPVKTDTRAVIQRNLLTGLASIDLVGSSENAETLSEPAPGENFPVIPEGQVGLEELKSAIPTVIDRANSVLQELAGFLDDENRGSVKRTLANIETITRNFSSRQQELDGMVDEVKKLAAELRAVTGTLSKDTREAVSAIRGTADVISRATAGISQDISVAADKLAATMEGFENPRKILVGPDKSAYGPGEGGGRR
jgi:phospholipid/cholesterol/gamma-HCH transport system substrate-binding protein